jgi:hypothetical protein
MYKSNFLFQENTHARGVVASGGFVISFFLLTLFLFFIVPLSFIYAQSNSSIGVAETYPVEGEPENGDLVSYNPETETYILSREKADTNVIGVVSVRPILLFETTDGGVPLVQAGQARIKVTDINGTIAPGDLLTSSVIPGKAERAGRDTPYVIGIALEQFPALGLEIEPSTFETTEGGVGAREGLILASLEIGPRFAVSQESKIRLQGAETRTAIQFIVAATIALGSIFFAFRNFAKTIQNGIISIGRNPLARRSIQISMFLYLMLILFISTGGVLLSMLVLRLEIF